MGSRASYVLIEHSGFTAYAEHWGAQTVPRLVAYGPAETISHIRNLSPVKWLPYGGGAEGGILVDADTRTLIFWGGEIITYAPNLRRLFLPALRRIWQGWSVSWATRGIVDVAEYPGVAESFGIELASLIEESADIDWHPFSESVVREPSEHRWNNTLIAVKWEDGRVTDYILDQVPPVDLMFGPPLIEVLREYESVAPPREDGSDAYQAIPEGGAYVDIVEHALWAWASSTTNPAHQECLAQAWLGWRIGWHFDGVAHQVALSGRDPALVTPPIAQVGVNLLSELTSSEFRIDAAQFAMLVEEYSAPVTAIPAPTVVRQDRPATSPEEQRESLIRLVAQVAYEQARDSASSRRDSRD